MASNVSETQGKNVGSQDLSLLVQDMVDQMNTKFTQMGESILGRMNEMNTRMDELEQCIGDLMNQAGLEPTTITTTTTPSRMHTTIDTAYGGSSPQSEVSRTEIGRM